MGEIRTMPDEPTLLSRQSKGYDYNKQKLERLKDPDVLIIRNMFGKLLVQKFLKHMQSMKSEFQQAEIKGSQGQNLKDKKIRNNTALFLTQLFPGESITSSVLGRNLVEAIQSGFLHQITNSSFYPIFDMATTNFSEIQVSRYGNAGQHYDWHIDRTLNNNQRWITLVYYFWKEPRRWKGGELGLTNGMTFNSKIIAQKPKPKIIKIRPENDMAVLFSSRTPHCVHNTISPNKFIDGRFSVNMWIGHVK